MMGRQKQNGKRENQTESGTVRVRVTGLGLGYTGLGYTGLGLGFGGFPLGSRSPNNGCVVVVPPEVLSSWSLLGGSLAAVTHSLTHSLTQASGCAPRHICRQSSPDLQSIRIYGLEA